MRGGERECNNDMAERRRVCKGDVARRRRIYEMPWGYCKENRDVVVWGSIEELGGARGCGEYVAKRRRV